MVRGALAGACVALSLLPPLSNPAADEPPESQAPVPEPEAYWSGPLNGPVPATIKGGTVIQARELAAMLEKSRVVVVDTSNAPKRPADLAPGALWLPPPHRAIPRSLWIPGSGLAEISPSVDIFFREQLAAATGHDLDHPIVIYCHERCWLSWNGAKRAISYGYRNVMWFADGIEGWRAAGLPTSVAEPAAPR